MSMLTLITDHQMYMSMLTFQYHRSLGVSFANLKEGRKQINNLSSILQRYPNRTVIPGRVSSFCTQATESHANRPEAGIGKPSASSSSTDSSEHKASIADSFNNIKLYMLSALSPCKVNVRGRLVLQVDYLQLLPALYKC